LFLIPILMVRSPPQPGVSTHEARELASSFETAASRPPQDEAEFSQVAPLMLSNEEFIS
jgi:hypothetical protein